MCGIAGFVARNGMDEDVDAVLGRMTSAIAHRGPDDAGAYRTEPCGIAIGHRRLSIIDTSPTGHQPMASASGRFHIAFNGEIYNFRELRQELSGNGTRWRGGSDTEVLLNAFERWGIQGAIQRAAGMFAIALWDEGERRLHLIRDRLGEKPLYYSQTQDGLIFGSELKALRTHPAWRGTVDRDALALLLRYAYVPAPYSIYKEVRKVPPGTIVSFDADSPQSAPRVEEYWSARGAALAGMREPLGGSEEEIIEACEARLAATIRQEMISDVPLGAFLSGGIDSSLVVALMQASSSVPVRTFTIGFHVSEFNEAEHARRVAGHLGTDHTELYVTPEETLRVIPLLPTLYDEPFADPSQIPTYLVARLARQHVTVALSGDGGDELFGGYNRYFLGQRIWDRLRHMPRVLRRGMARGISSISPARWDGLLNAAGGLLPAGRFSVSGDRIHKLAGIVASESPESLYRDLVSHWRTPERVVLGAREPESIISSGAGSEFHDFTTRMMYLDLVSYLPDDILVKVDRATMGVSLESRAPFLDHRVVEFAWRVPQHMKVRQGSGKWILKQLLRRHVPDELIDRPKMGFGVPIDRWLRGPLREWAGDLLDPSALRSEGYFDEPEITRKWQEHLGGTRNWQYLLWDVLMFQAWLRA